MLFALRPFIALFVNNASLRGRILAEKFFSRHAFLRGRVLQFSYPRKRLEIKIDD